MNAHGKELRKRIRSYFGKVESRVQVFVYRNQMCVDVEYEDFHSEKRVMSEIRSIIGNDCLLNVKREYSDTMLADMAVCVVRKLPREESLRIIRRHSNSWEWMENYERASCG